MARGCLEAQRGSRACARCIHTCDTCLWVLGRDLPRRRLRGAVREDNESKKRGGGADGIVKDGPMDGVLPRRAWQ